MLENDVNLKKDPYIKLENPPILVLLENFILLLFITFLFLLLFRCKNFKEYITLIFLILFLFVIILSKFSSIEVYRKKTVFTWLYFFKVKVANKRINRLMVTPKNFIEVAKYRRGCNFLFVFKGGFFLFLSYAWGFRDVQRKVELVKRMVEFFEKRGNFKMCVKIKDYKMGGI